MKYTYTNIVSTSSLLVGIFQTEPQVGSSSINVNPSITELVTEVRPSIKYGLLSAALGAWSGYGFTLYGTKYGD